MPQDTSIELAVAPWLRKAEHLSAWLARSDTGLNPGQAGRAHDTLRTARRVLNSLAAGEVAIPAELPSSVPGPTTPRSHPARTGLMGGLSDRHLQGFPSWLGGWQPGKPATSEQGQPVTPVPITVGQLRAGRDAVLRLGVWDALRVMIERTEQGQEATQLMSGLMRSISRPAMTVPPGVAPALGFAASAAAAAFFNDTLRSTLRRLAAAYDHLGAQFQALADTPSFDMTGVAVERWTRAWTAAAAATYIDSLFCNDASRLFTAQMRLWRKDDKCSTPLRFRAPEGLITLPTKGKLHVDLWTGPVLAQVLDHQPVRWQASAAGQAWHSVALPIHDLYQRDCGEQLDNRNTVYRGLSVGMLYQTAFIDQVGCWLAQATAEEPDMTQATPPAKPNTVELRLPGGQAGQRTELHIIIDWPGDASAAAPALDAAGPRPSGMRSTRPKQPITLDAAQRQVVEVWRQRRQAQASPDSIIHLSPKDMGWRAAEADGNDSRHHDDETLPLGSAALWAAAGLDAEWLELSMQVHWGGQCHDLALSWGDELINEPEPDDVGSLAAPRSWLAIHADSLAALQLSISMLRKASRSDAACHWTRHALGLGAAIALTVDLDQLIQQAPAS